MRRYYIRVTETRNQVFYSDANDEDSAMKEVQEAALNGGMYVAMRFEFEVENVHEVPPDSPARRKYYDQET